MQALTSSTRELHYSPELAQGLIKQAAQATANCNKIQYYILYLLKYRIQNQVFNLA